MGDTKFEGFLLEVGFGPDGGARMRKSAPLPQMLRQRYIPERRLHVVRRMKKKMQEPNFANMKLVQIAHDPSAPLPFSTRRVTRSLSRSDTFNATTGLARARRPGSTGIKESAVATCNLKSSAQPAAD
jgi:hypothetical protein